MGRLILRWIILAVAIVAAGKVAKAVHIAFEVDADQASDWPRLLLGAALLGFLNATLGNILKALTIPLSCLTLGLFSLVVNGFIVWLASQANLGFAARGFWPAFVGALIISIVSGILGVVVQDSKGK